MSRRSGWPNLKRSAAAGSTAIGSIKERPTLWSAPSARSPHPPGLSAVDAAITITSPLLSCPPLTLAVLPPHPRSNGSEEYYIQRSLAPLGFGDHLLDPWDGALMLGSMSLGIKAASAAAELQGLVQDRYSSAEMSRVRASTASCASSPSALMVILSPFFAPSVMSLSELFALASRSPLMTTISEENCFAVLTNCAAGRA